ncbi:MAG: BatD family protein [Verrucomicrobiota bacterium]
MKWLYHFVLFVFLPWMAWSQSVNWSPSKGTFEKGVQSRLNLVFKDCEPAGNFGIPDVDGLEIGQSNSQQTHISSISGMLGGKGKVTTLGFPVLAGREGEVIIPSFRIATSKGEIEVPAARFQVVPAQIGSSSMPNRQSSLPGPRLSVEDVAQAEIVLEKQELWAGEVQQARLVFQGMTRFVRNIRGYEWDPQQLTLGPWQPHDEDLRVVDGNEVTVFEFPVQVQAPRVEGEYQVDSARVGITIRAASSSRSAFDMFRNRGQQVTLEAKAPEIKVKPLPAPPENFSGAVGEFELASQLLPEVTSVGEPITWTLEMRGTGNWNDVIRMPSRRVPEGFEVIQPKSNIEMQGDSPFTGKMIEDVVLIPTREGTYTIPGVSLIYFDTNAGKYRTLTTADKKVRVEAKKTSALAPGQAAGPQAGFMPMPSTQAAVPPFDRQPQLPRDPLNQSISSGRPLSLPAWSAGLLLPWLGVLCYWCWLAWQQMVLLDSGRSQREARQRLLSWQAAVDVSRPAPSHLREWQRQVECLWQVSRPVPNASLLRQAVNEAGGDGDEWVWLWSCCEAILFGREQTLPPEWSPRFAAAITAVKVPRVRLAGCLKPQVWLPVLTAMLLTSSLWAQENGTDKLIANSDTEYYQSGEFQRSEAALRLRLADDWGDSGAHHDLALALWQQERWDEAAAHASVAAIQAPGNESIFWNVRLLTNRAGWGATTTGKFFDSSHILNRMVAWRSVHFWQWLGIGASLLLAGLALWGIQATYHHGGRGRQVRGSLAVLMLLLLVISLFCVERWGMLRHPYTVIVMEEVDGRSIPSEVDQQTRPLPVGTVGFFKDEFLGWRKVMLPNQEEVWVREEEVLPVYRH